MNNKDWFETQVTLTTALNNKQPIISKAIDIVVPFGVFPQERKSPPQAH